MNFQSVRRLVHCMLISLGAIAAVSFGAPAPAVTDSVQNVFVPEVYQHNQTYAGYLGAQCQISLQYSLNHENLNYLFDSLKTPASGICGSWVGEYPGKFLDACCNAWKYTGNAQLKARMDSMATMFHSYQGTDGYLGSYPTSCRWQNWDVWNHKYNILSLLNYYECTGDTAALNVCKRMGDLLCNTFGTGKLNIASGPFDGMANTSVLEAMTQLYRYTGDSKYLAFCTYMVSSWATSSKILTGQLAGQDITYVDPKAYEKMSNLIGLVDLYRLTKNPDYLTACQNAWANIFAHHHLICGAPAADNNYGGGAFAPADSIPPNQALEGCNLVTWTQFTWQMFKLTGATKYADELERICYNAMINNMIPTNAHLAQVLLNGHRWGEGPLDSTVYEEHSCCYFSLQRAISLIPFIAAGTLSGNAMVLLYGLSGDHNLSVMGYGGLTVPVQLHIDSHYPDSGVVRIAVKPGSSDAFTVCLYVPSWSTNFSASVGGQSYPGTAGSFVSINRQWSAGDTIKVSIPLRTRMVWDGWNVTPHKFAVRRGPQLLSIDAAVTGTTLPGGWAGGTQVYDIPYTFGGQSLHQIMVPFAQAGQTGSLFTTAGDSITITAGPTAVSQLPHTAMTNSLRGTTLTALIPSRSGKYEKIAVAGLAGESIASVLVNDMRGRCIDRITMDAARPQVTATAKSAASGTCLVTITTTSGRRISQELVIN